MSNSSSTARRGRSALERRRPAGSRRANAAISLRGVLDVVELDHLDRRVHVAQRDRDEPGRDAAARDVDRVGVGARCRAPSAATVNGISSASAASMQQLEHARVQRRAARDHRPGAERGACRAPARLDAGLRRSRTSRRPTIAMSGRRRSAVVRAPRERRSPPARPRPRRRRRARRRPRRRAAPPRARRSSRGGCPSSARRRGRWAARPARRRSPRRRRRAPARAPRRRPCAPMSMCRSFSSGAFLRSSAFIRWIGFLPITPGTAPSRVASSTRWPTSTCGSQPPTPVKRRKPVVVDVRDDQPDLVDVADDRERRAAAGAGHARGGAAHDVPSTSSANVRAASRKAAARRVSYPDGPGTVRQRAENGRDRHDA